MRVSISICIMLLGLAYSCQSVGSDVGRIDEAALPRNLQLVRFASPVTKIDLQGSGQKNDLVIKGYKESGTAYSPTIYSFLTYDVTDKKNNYHFITIPDNASSSDIQITGSWTSAGCFGIMPAFFSGEVNKKLTFFSIIAKRESKIKNSVIEYDDNLDLSIYRIEKSDGLPGVNYFFLKIASVKAKSSACDERDLYAFERKILGKLR